MEPQLILFDIDGTVVEAWTDKILPGVSEFFSRPNLPKIAWVTNQCGVGLRHWMEKEGFGEPEKFPTEEQVIERIETILYKLGLTRLDGDRDTTYISFAYQTKEGKWGPQKRQTNVFAPDRGEVFTEWRKDWRKPAPGMLLQAMTEAGVAPDDTLFVGDMESDRLAAEAAGVRFMWARDFFGWED